MPLIAPTCPNCRRQYTSLRKCVNPKCGMIICSSCGYNCPVCFQNTLHIR